MGFFRRFLGLETRSAGSWGELERLILAANSTAAGIAVSPEGALECSTVFACIKTIAESIGFLPLHAYQKAADGGRHRLEDHPVSGLLNRLANDWTPAGTFRADMTAAALIHGDAFAHIGRASDGRPLELIQIPNRNIAVETDNATLEPRYVLTGENGVRREIDRHNILHLRAFGTTPNRGLSPVHQARNAIGLALALEHHASRLMRRGARPAGTLEVPGKLSDPAVARLRASVQGLHAGSESGSTMVLEEGAKYSPLTFSSVDLQFAQMRTFQVSEISRCFRVPLSLINEMERTTHSNAESLGRQFLSLTLGPWLRTWTETVWRDLFNEGERDSVYCEFQVGALEMTDIAAQVDALTKGISGGLYTSDEARAKQNLPPMGGTAALLRLPLNTESAGQGAAANA